MSIKMQKYIKTDLSEIRYFEVGVKVGDWIDLNPTDEQVDAMWVS